MAPHSLRITGGAIMNHNRDYDRLSMRTYNALASIENLHLPPCPSYRCPNVPALEVGLLTGHFLSATGAVDKSRDYEDKA